jgi:HTH-type transcriptional regulator, glycine betaine synthesis regulator
MPSETMDFRDTKTSAPSDGNASLNAAERESIDLIVDLASAFGLPRSVAEIYGLLFVSDTLLSLEDMRERLGISIGSASQGLRLLRNLGAVVPVVKPGDRRTYYQAEVRLKVLIPGFIREQVLPRLEAWPQRVDNLREAGNQVPAPQQALINERCKQLAGWSQKAKLAMPLLLKLTQS